MAVLFVKKYRERFAELLPFARRVIAFSGLATFFWIASTSWILGHDANEILAFLQVDKIIHFAGGVFVAGMLMIGGGILRRARLVIMVAIVGVLWEVWEIYFLPDQLIRFHSEFYLWLFDSALDFCADLLGAYFFCETTQKERK